jgi:ubiquinone/menaquinone biosynthesis C-methylase UbiE
MSDRWADWLRRHRYGDDPSWKERTLAKLEPVRDRVLDLAELSPGETVLDVGTGEGLIAFGALERIAPGGRVIFSDVSQPLLDQCREIAEELDVSERCTFVEASAENLSAIESESVDVVTTRSVLIYFRDKAAALREFFRVLRPGGRIASFEPINSFGHPRPEHLFWGYDVTPVQDLSRKVSALYRESAEESGESTLIDFDERDLFAWTESAGFTSIHMHYEAVVAPESPLAGISWDAFLRFSGNPLAPTMAEAVDRALTEAERERFFQHLRPLVERGEGTSRLATVYLAAKMETGARP